MFDESYKQAPYCCQYHVCCVPEINISQTVIVIHESRGERGSGTPSLKNYKNIGFSSNTGPDPLKNRKATKPALKCWAIIEWCFAGVPMMAH